MKEKLIIKNFGPIKDVELELNLVNILIGDQGTGKSTVSKLYTLIYNYAYYDVFDIENSHDSNTLKFFRNLELFGVLNYLHQETEIRLDSSRFQFEFAEGVVKTKHPELYKMSLSEMPEKMKDYFSFNYIPAERILVSTLANALYSLMLNDVSLPKLFLRFGDKFQKGRQRKEIFNFKNTLGIDYKYANDRDIVILPSGKEILIQEASSGIQGSVPLLIVFDFVSQSSAQGNLLVIEEPELNSFPETQNKLIKYFIEANVNGVADGKVKYKNQLLLTTHSPYILTSLNNLMYAYQVGKNEREKVKKIVKEKYWLNPDNVSAYMMLPNGQCENIIDKEGLIKAEKIDSISTILNKDFNALMDIELKVKK